MEYFMRYFVESDAVPTMGDLALIWATFGEGYTLLDGEMRIGENIIGALDIYTRGDGDFEEEVEEFEEYLKESDDEEGVARVKECLELAKMSIGIEVNFDPEDPEGTMDLLMPLWDWLFIHHPGLLQADMAGFYNATEMVLELA